MSQSPVTTDAKVKSAVWKAADKYTRGIFPGDTWKQVNDLTKEIQAALPTLGLVEVKDDPFYPRKWKKWKYAGDFVTPAGATRWVVVFITASGAGSVEDPMDKYDITMNVEVMAPKTVTDEKVREYLQTEDSSQEKAASVVGVLDRFAGTFEPRSWEGKKCKFKETLEPGDKDIVMTVVEDRGTRVLVTDSLTENWAIPSTKVYSKEDLILI